MAKGKSNITTENMTEWMASTGFLFPRTIVELARFQKLYGDVQEDLTGCAIDPDIILGYKTRAIVVEVKKLGENLSEPQFRMAARKGGDGLVPKNIMDKIKKNQDKRKQDDPGSEKNESE